MFDLSDRMEMVAQAVRNLGDIYGRPMHCVADIGCDHAFVAMHLVQSGVCERAIASDVRSGPLIIASQNIAREGLESLVEPRLSNGFSAIAPGEADVAVIAGMGGRLICDILSAAEEHMKNGVGLVLSPHVESEIVRRFVLERDYTIEDETMVLDAGKYYNIITAIPAERSERPVGLSFYSDVELRYGKTMLDMRSNVLHFYLNKEHGRLMELLNKLAVSDADVEIRERRLNEIEAELRVIDAGLAYYEGGAIMTKS